jgi:CubicO group peptidase (beta-lactamase class C family)
MRMVTWSMRYFYFFILFSPKVVCSQSLYYPDSVWMTKNPADLKMNKALLDSAVHFAIRNDSKTNYDLRIADLEAYADEPGFRILGPTKQRGKPAGLIIKSGYIVAQWGDVSRVDMTFSVTKSYLSSIAGLAIDKGLIRNLDEPVNEYVTDNTFDGAHNSKITWRHLLTQSSDWSGSLFGLYDWADRPVPANGGIDGWSHRDLYEPGSHFKYNDVRVNLLAYSLLQVWRKPLPFVLKEKIMDPIGASVTWRWYGYDNSFVNIDGLMMQSVSGGGHFGGGLFISTLDQARYGLLFLRKGKWKNQQLISENWVKSVQQPSSANKSYGFLWWLNDDGRYKDAPKSIFLAEGFGGNFIVVDNDDDLLLVVRWLEPSALNDFIRLAISSIQKN